MSGNEKGFVFETSCEKSVKRQSAKQFFKEHFTANPLSYLGWLGFLGILGVIFVPVFVPFLLCFFFFTYRNVVADELFWNHVHKACTRAFWAVFALDAFVAVILFIRGMAANYQGKSVPLQFTEGYDMLTE